MCLGTGPPLLCHSAAREPATVLPFLPPWSSGSEFFFSGEDRHTTRSGQRHPLKTQEQGPCSSTPGWLQGQWLAHWLYWGPWGFPMAPGPYSHRSSGRQSAPVALEGLVIWHQRRLSASAPWQQRRCRHCLCQHSHHHHPQTEWSQQDCLSLWMIFGPSLRGWPRF